MQLLLFYSVLEKRKVYVRLCRITAGYGKGAMRHKNVAFSSTNLGAMSEQTNY